MASALSKKRKFTVQPATAPNSEINVTPLVDVVLVLLIIFMVVTPLLEDDIEVKVPETEQVEQVTEIPPNQVVVGVSGTGDITINNEPIAEVEYLARMKQILAGRRKAERTVFFLAPDASNYGKLVTVLDQTRRAGAETLAMMTEPPPASP